jgi:hypothetical protein
VKILRFCNRPFVRFHVTRENYYTSARMSAKHFTVGRLVLMTNSDPVVLTEGDFAHLQECRACFLKWKRYARKAVFKDSHEVRSRRAEHIQNQLRQNEPHEAE